MNASPTPAASRSGATLIELLASMAILSVLILVLSMMLESAMGRFRRGTDAVQQRGGARVAAEWIERDLASHLSSRPAALPRLPDGIGEIQRAFFEGRLFLPFEANRRQSSDGTEGSFANAAAGFGTLAFATRPSLRPGEPEAAAPALVGYYVAYARHSPLAKGGQAGMKLFRHYRRGGHPTAEGYADGLIHRVSLATNDERDPSADPRPLAEPNTAAVRQGRFDNAALPLLFAKRLGRAGDLPRPVDAVQPWPVHPVRERLASPPPSYDPARGSAKDWDDPSSAVHDSVFPDEVVCDHVVRFEVAPYRRVVLEDGGSALMGAAELNVHLGLGGGDEWPALVVPDFVDLVIATITEPLALRLARYEDWLVDWPNDNPASWGEARREIERELRTHRFRIALPPRSA